MMRPVIHKVVLLMGVVAALHNIGGITAYAKEDDDFLRGGGTKYNPYLVSSYEDLVRLRDMVDGGNNLEGVYFRQTEDISFPNGINWNPIGDLEHAFAGVYDGNGYVISNIYCNDTHAGFFSLLAGEVRNLGIESGGFYGDYIGSITSHGWDNAKIINCYNKADVCGNGRAGGIMDNFSGLALFCWNFGSVTGTNEEVVTAGITSYGKADVRYCYAAGADKLVSDATFTGKMADSELIVWEETSVYVQQSYEDMFAVYAEAKENEDKEGKEKDLITRGNTVFIVCDDGGFHFDKEYEPEIFLAEKQEEKKRFIEIWKNKYRFEGKGTEEEPFLVSSYEDLTRLRDCVDAGHNFEKQYFEQTEDIYFPDAVNWNPIGDLEHSFAGVYNGGGHVIFNIYCDDKHAGLFSMLTGEIRNLGLENGTFHGDYIGSITSHGSTEAKIINCYNRTDVIGNYRAGGLVDNFQGEILYSWNFGRVLGKQDAVRAGICSYGMPKTEIRHCYSTAEVEVVNPKTFRGELYESCKIENADVVERLRQNEAVYSEAIRDEKLVADDICFFNLVGSDQIGYDKSYIPDGVMYAERMVYFPEGLLVGITVLLGSIMLIVGYRYRKFTKAGEESQQEDNDGLDWITIDRKVSWNNISSRIGKRAGAVILTVIIFILVFSKVMGVCKLEFATGVLNLKFLRKVENRNTDVLFVGSSMSAQIELGDLWKEKGIVAYNIAAGNASNCDSYYRLIEADRDHSCKLIVVEMRGAALNWAMDTEMQHLQNITAVDMSLNKLRYINASLEPQERLYYLLDFPLFHGRYGEVTKWDFIHTSSFGEEDKGNWILNYGSNNKLKLDSAIDVIGYKALDQKQEYYLRKIIEYCVDNDRDLLLLKMPNGNRLNDQPFYNTVSLIAEEYGVPFLDMNLYDEKIGLTSADFWTDNWHLNVEGARKCTNFLGDYLMENYMLLDHRGDEDYASWDRFAANREDLYLRAITDNTDYFNELHRDQRKIIAVSSGMSLEKSEQYLSVKEKLEDLEYELYDAEDVLYGEENQNTWILGSNTVMVQKDYQERKISINGKINLSVDSPGIILIVYDEVTDQVADVAAFTNANGFSVQHLYEGGED